MYRIFEINNFFLFLFEGTLRKVINFCVPLIRTNTLVYKFNPVCNVCLNRFLFSLIDSICKVISQIHNYVDSNLHNLKVNILT